MITNKFKYIFYVFFFGSFIYFLHLKGWLTWVIAGASILYLIFYFTVGTLAIFMTSLDELGPLVRDGTASSPLLTLVILVPIIFVLWIVMLCFWPLFLIPDESLRKAEKYDAILKFESAVQKKYKSPKDVF